MNDRRQLEKPTTDAPLPESSSWDRRRSDRRRLDRRYTQIQIEDWSPIRIPSRLFSAAEGLTIRTHLKSGDIGWLTWLHGIVYAREQGWDHTFEAYVAEPLAQFALRRNRRERIWLVECIDRIGIAMDDRELVETEALEGRESPLPLENDWPPPEAYPSIVGSIAIIETAPEEAQLRWLFLTPEIRGKGIGRKLMEKAIAFAKESHYKYVFLWTTSDLEDAARLYAAAGFRLIEEITHELWGKVITEQKWEIELPE